MEKEWVFGSGRVRITAYSNNAVRIRLSCDFKESLFDRYRLYRKPDDEAGRLLENGIAAGDLSVTFSDGILTFGTEKFERKMDVRCIGTETIKAYFNTLFFKRQGKEAEKGCGA